MLIIECAKYPHSTYEKIKACCSSTPPLAWRTMECNPLVFQGSWLPPFCVPPEQFPFWTDRDEEDYKFWLTKSRQAKLAR